MCHLSVLIYRDLFREKKSAIQPVTIPDTDATFVRGEVSSDSVEATEAFRG